MSKFYDKIRDQINLLPEKETTAQDWQRFVKHRNSKSSISPNYKKRIAVLVFSALLIFSAVTNYLLHQDVKQIKQELETINNLKQNDTSTKEILPASNSEEKLTQETIESSTDKTKPHLAKIIFDQKAFSSVIENSTHNGLEEKSNSDPSDQKNSKKTSIVTPFKNDFTAQSADAAQHLKIIKQLGEKSNAASQSNNKNTILPSMMPEQKEITLLLAPLNYIKCVSDASMPLTTNYNFSKATTSMVDLSSLPNTGNWNIEIYRSMNHLAHKQLEDKFAFANGIKINYQLKRNLAIGIYADVQESEYVSDATIDAFGLRDIAAPSPNQELSSIEAEIQTISAGLSFIYSNSLYKGLGYYLGPSLGFTKELNRELEYEFEGESENEDEDDDVVIESNDPLILYPWTYRIEAGLNYALPFRFNINLGMSYQNQFLKGKESLPIQYGLKLGLSKDL